MRSYILTDLEAQEIQNYLETGKSTNHISVIRGRVRKFLPKILEDLKLIQSLLDHGKDAPLGNLRDMEG